MAKLVKISLADFQHIEGVMRRPICGEIICSVGGSGGEGDSYLLVNADRLLARLEIIGREIRYFQKLITERGY